MKKILFPLCLTFFIVSCKPDSQSTQNTPAVTSYLSSVWDYSSGDTTIDSFSYTPSHAIGTFAQYSRQAGGSDSVIDAFSFNGTDTLPDAYTSSTFGVSSLEIIPHLLYYDNQNRIIKDTATDGSDFVTYFSYTASTTNITVLFDGTTNDEETFTLNFSGGNLVSGIATFPNQTATFAYTYSSYVNPAYYPNVAKTVAPLLFSQSVNGYGGYQDFFSQKFANSLNGVSGSETTDGKGRVSTATIPSSTDNEIFHYY